MANRGKAQPGKTNRSAQKRFKTSGRGKILRRPVRQNHFNARADGNAKRGKRGFRGLPGQFDKAMQTIINQ